MDDELDFDRWESAVGKIVMSLSRIEGELLMKYESHLSKTKYFNDTFKERISRIHELYNAECGNNSTATSLFKQVSDDIEYRNLVAHNPVYADTTGDFLKFEISTIKTDGISIDLSELECEAKRIWTSCIDLTYFLRVWAKN
jgi:hypothetical protein